MNYQQALFKQEKPGDNFIQEYHENPSTKELRVKSRTFGVCRNYQQNGKCKFGLKCRWSHQLVSSKRGTITSIELPDDVLNLIFRELQHHYVADVMLVSVRWHRCITIMCPLKTYLFTDIMNGGYTDGCAVAVARSKNDAIYQICWRLHDDFLGQKPSGLKSALGLWLEEHEFRNVDEKEEIIKTFKSDIQFSYFIKRIERKKEFGGVTPRRPRIRKL